MGFIRIKLSKTTNYQQIELIKSPITTKVSITVSLTKTVIWNIKDLIKKTDLIND